MLIRNPLQDFFFNIFSTYMADTKAGKDLTIAAKNPNPSSPGLQKITSFWKHWMVAWLLPTNPLSKWHRSLSSLGSFLSPYRRTRYHRRDIDGQRPQNSKELINFWHSSLCNAVERTIGLLKKIFAYLRHQPFHDISTQAKIVLACCAIHNFLRIDYAEDVCEEDFDSSDDEVIPTHADVPKEKMINAHISFNAEASWSNNRDAIAQSMWVNHNPNADAEI
ncbi:putative harbinger transposase-derived nuclease [Abeliophyllum distichum]|uniref:Harbinger transposase-derived nuclease n=1 Tax=Abeliophyllum distichum TaxID=126358 RepID=A0ABD1UMQ1_9LAMI